MAVEIIMPKIAMAQTEGQLVEWLVEEGKWVEKGSPLMMIETEKVTQECESIGTGYLVPKKGLQGVVPCGTVLGWLAENEQELAKLKAKPEGSPPTIKDESFQKTYTNLPINDNKMQGMSSQISEMALPSPTTNTETTKFNISPVAKRKALEHNLNLSSIIGSGPGGRIVMKDIDIVLEKMAVESTVQPGVSVESVKGLRVKATIPLQGMRKSIADNVSKSQQVAAEVTFGYEIDMTQVIKLRERLLSKEKELGARITYTDILVLFLVKAVRQVPIVNSTLINNEIKIWEDINVSLAVALDLGPYESGLITPVIKNAENKSLTEISLISKELIEKAKSRTLTSEEISGGTITLSNIGVYAPGWTISTPIINQPQAMIVQPGAIVEKPVVINGDVVVRPIMSVSITFDHRIMDGVPPLKWITLFKELLENPYLLCL